MNHAGDGDDKKLTVIAYKTINIVEINQNVNSGWYWQRQILWETCPVCQVKSEVLAARGECHYNPYYTKICKHCEKKPHTGTLG
jgi:hypothetical protein